MSLRRIVDASIGGCVNSRMRRRCEVYDGRSLIAKCGDTIASRKSHSYIRANLMHARDRGDRVTHAAQRRHQHEFIASTTRVQRRSRALRCVARRIAAHTGSIGGAQVTSSTNPAAQGDAPGARTCCPSDSREPVTTG